MYRVELIPDPAIVSTFLTVDRARHAYMIGDLVPPYWSPTLFYGAFDDSQPDGASLRAVVLVYAPIQPPPLISAGDPAAVTAIFEFLSKRQMVSQVMYHTLPEHMLALEQFFVIHEHPTPMWRMAITREYFQPTANSNGTIRRLTGTDAVMVQGAFDSGSSEDFMSGHPQITPDLLDNGIFYGAFADSEGSQLVAVAGTHIVSPAERISTVGFVFTRPDQRGHGYATQATAGVTGHLLALGIDLVVLNVRQINTPAIRAYERIGYQRHNALYEGFADRRAISR